MKVDYMNHMGGDHLVVDAARCSFNKLADQYTDEQNTKLVNYLAKHKHISPFFHPQITLRMTVPIWLARQSFKHAIGSAKNEISRRYITEDIQFHTPTWRHRPGGSVKQGSGEEITDQKEVFEIDQLYISTCQDAIDTYNKLLLKGVAPEQARAVLPQGTYTTYVDTGSLYYWSRVYKARVDSNAQKEWQFIINEIDQIMQGLYPVSWAALKNDGQKT